MGLQSTRFIIPLLLLTPLLLISTNTFSSAQAPLCRSSCGSIPIRYPFGIDEGCGHHYYRNLLSCSLADSLHLRTPSGVYPVESISYTDPHIIVTDPTMWSCHVAPHRPPTTPFALDGSTHFSLSSKNRFLFFNCSEDSVIVEPRPNLCSEIPGSCPSACDGSDYLCRNLPGCPKAGELRCCAYFPTASTSLRMMVGRCAAYAGVYWREAGSGYPPYDRVAEYGIRVDFEIPVSLRCLRCQDGERSGGVCGFEPSSRGFLCLCGEGFNVTDGYCGGLSGRKPSVGVVAGTTTVASIAGIAGIGGLVLFLKKMRTNKVVSCGVQSNENRLF